MRHGEEGAPAVNGHASLHWSGGVHAATAERSTQWSRPHGAAMDPDRFRQLAEGVSLTIDALGVLVMVLGIAWAGVRWLRGRRPAPGEPADSPYRRARQDVGRGILLGLELMVAGDIIRTVAVEPTLDSLLVLGGIVLIRTFLSIALEVELEGRWPWRHASEDGGPRR